MWLVLGPYYMFGRTPRTESEMVFDNSKQLASLFPNSISTAASPVKRMLHKHPRTNILKNYPERRHTSFKYICALLQNLSLKILIIRCILFLRSYIQKNETAYLDTPCNSCMGNDLPVTLLSLTSLD